MTLKEAKLIVPISAGITGALVGYFDIHKWMMGLSPIEMVFFNGALLLAFMILAGTAVSLQRMLEGEEVTEE